MPADHAYDYAIVRLTPRVERGETINVGVIVSCPERDYLAARIELDAARVRALDAAFDIETARAHLDAIPRICRGGAEAGALGELPARARFHWLVAPRSTVIQMSPVHTGRTDDPDAALERLLDTLVRVAPSDR
ncbi:MAG TPA: DUF3037 domain-containing protein [Vicinamibacteria bacterium]|nr:DUF3037 domain-containing protein [Vicinamibacteria bacterium]